MVQVELTKIIIDEKRQDQVIVLKEKDGDRQIPIVIGFMEASAIKMKISGIEVPRPLTHDLLVSVIKAMDGQLMRLIIDKLETSTFFAKLEVKRPSGDLKLIDCRPSDGIAAAVRTKCPIFVDEEVLTKASTLKQ
ncbi:MAG: bifunctional nuclease family protein [Candidatus Omnitrophica bacterium]|nr:bifunctional nuclease family protein [Candidatus Omnitrophota bacterium]